MKTLLITFMLLISTQALSFTPEYATEIATKFLCSKSSEEMKSISGVPYNLDEKALIFDKHFLKAQYDIYQSQVSPDCTGRKFKASRHDTVDDKLNIKIEFTDSFLVTIETFDKKWPHEQMLLMFLNEKGLIVGMID